MIETQKAEDQLVEDITGAILGEPVEMAPGAHVSVNGIAIRELARRLLKTSDWPKGTPATTAPFVDRTGDPRTGEPDVWQYPYLADTTNFDEIAFNMARQLGVGPGTPGWKNFLDASAGLRALFVVTQGKRAR